MASGIASMEIRAPLSGVIVPLDAVPDPVFARKMVGDGVSIDPTSSEVLAPVAGEVTQLHDAHHALAITAPNGVEVLVHVGLDTVTLGGRGFTPLVSRGDQVEVGQPVLRLDADGVARSARSLLTEVVVTTADRVARLVPARGVAIAGQTVLLTVELADGAARTAEAAGEAVVSDAIEIVNPAGLHARPAAVLAAEAKRYAAQVTLVRGTDEVNVRSIIGVLGLSTKRGELVRIKAVGRDARAAATDLAALVASGCGEDPSSVPVATAAEPRTRRAPSVPGELTGAPASPGLAIGRVLQHRHAAIHVQERGGPAADERAKLGAAIRETARQIETLQRHSPDRGKAQIMGVQLALLEDPDLLGAMERLLDAGKSA
ncbi:MAG TPA: glucose PTS transporter subunit IIA, partial [Anaeromyxobacteraceae bacterium]|nr:glucose PTS transporter subunit IIA [Anaeromyxobacteraceae bacterium]